ncbi:hypothetical protein INR49_008475 [Caranx melampygus]|nr:hypothetical protein INR49_008475 [Caranx melampygus]
MYIMGEMGNGNSEGKTMVLLSLLLNALLFVTARIQVKGKVGPLITWGEGDGLAQGEAHCVNDALASRLSGAHADGGGPAGGAHYVGRWGKIRSLSVLHDALPDDVLELCRNLQPGQISSCLPEHAVLIRIQYVHEGQDDREG